MAQGQNGKRTSYGSNGVSADEYRRQQAARAAKRAKRRRQRMLVLGAFALAAIVLIVCIILLIRSIFFKKDKPDSSAPPTSNAEELGEYTPVTTWPTASDPNVWNLQLVNEQNRLDANFPEPDLGSIAVVTSEGAVSYLFDSRMVDTLQQMVDDCNAVEGHSLQIISGYRGYDRQDKNYQYQVTQLTDRGMAEEEAREEAKKIESTAGASDHHTGLAVKFVTANVRSTDESFASTPEYAWLAEHAANYGFVMRYPAEKAAITGMDYQPYHWRYVGVEDAQTMKQANLCLEEYLASLPAEITTPAADEGGGEGQLEEGGDTSGGEDPAG